METRFLKLGLIVLSLAMDAAGQPQGGRWDGTIRIGDLQTPFRLHLETAGSAITAVFVNGDDRGPTGSGTFEGGRVHLRFEATGTTLEAKLADGALKGSYGSVKLGTHAIEAIPFCTCGSEGEAGPDISGVWQLSGGVTGRMTIQRKGEDTLVSVEDAKGTLAGRFDGVAFILHHFDGERAMVMDLEPRKDGALEVVWKEPGRVRKALAARNQAKN